MTTKYLRTKILVHWPRLSRPSFGIPALSLLIMAQVSCKKLVDIPPPVNLIAQNNVYTNDGSAIAVLTGTYINMSTPGGSGTGGFSGGFSVSELAGLSADELALYGGVSYTNLIAYYSNALAAIGPNTAGSEHWAPLYNYIFQCNAAIEGLNNYTGLTPAVRQQLLGEAKFLRAFFYFYLVNLYGDVPLALTTDPNVNTLLGRTPKAQVYQQMIADLKDAQSLLSINYLDAKLISTTSERVRPTKWAATAMLARVYLFSGDYIDAEAQATSVINAGLYSLPSLNNVFLKNSNEAIWQLQPTTATFNTEDARLFIIPSTGLSNSTPVYLSGTLLNSFEQGDQRRYNLHWVDSITIGGTTFYYPYKYKIDTSNAAVTTPASLTEYLMVLRLAEQYLIRAEARAQQNNVGGSQNDLDTIRARAGLPITLANDRASLLTAVLHERQVELFTEWGHRWMDLKRTGNIDAVMNIATHDKAGGAPWQSYQQLYPIPQSDINQMRNLTQNTGY